MWSHIEKLLHGGRPSALQGPESAEETFTDKPGYQYGDILHPFLETGDQDIASFSAPNILRFVPREIFEARYKSAGR